MVKHKGKHFGEINIGDLDTIISYMCLNLQLRLILMCVCCVSGVVDMDGLEAKVPL